MPITSLFARVCPRVAAYHVIAAGDTPADLDTWFKSLFPDPGPGGPDGWFVDNSDGTIGCWDGMDEVYVPGSVGDYLVLPAAAVMSESYFLANYFPEPA